MMVTGIDKTCFVLLVVDVSALQVLNRFRVSGQGVFEDGKSFGKYCGFSEGVGFY